MGDGLLIVAFALVIDQLTDAQSMDSNAYWQRWVIAFVVVLLGLEAVELFMEGVMEYMDVWNFLDWLNFAIFFYTIYLSSKLIHILQLDPHNVSQHVCWRTCVLDG